jgi:uncharacterized protein YutE (UPF0331/DUF86 family)
MQSLTRDEFMSSYIVTSSAERSFQVAIQAALDIGGVLLSETGISVPREYREIFPGMAHAEILPVSFANKLVNMAKFRNVLVHLYVEVDLEQVFYYIQHNLDDFVLYGQYVSNYIRKLDDEARSDEDLY